MIERVVLSLKRMEGQASQNPPCFGSHSEHAKRKISVLIKFPGHTPLSPSRSHVKQNCEAKKLAPHRTDPACWPCVLALQLACSFQRRRLRHRAPCPRSQLTAPNHARRHHARFARRSRSQSWRCAYRLKRLHCPSPRLASTCSVAWACGAYCCHCENRTQAAATLRVLATKLRWRKRPAPRHL